MPSKLDPRVLRLSAKIGEKLRAARVASGRTQTEIAAELKMDRPSLSRIEAGRTNVTIESLIRIAGAFGLTVSIDFREAPKRQRRSG
ncbi:MAG: helix-turn-helix transcriptional regulator [Polyangiaceae bacterium]